MNRLPHLVGVVLAMALPGCGGPQYELLNRQGCAGEYNVVISPQFAYVSPPPADPRRYSACSEVTSVLGRDLTGAAFTPLLGSQADLEAARLVEDASPFGISDPAQVGRFIVSPEWPDTFVVGCLMVGPTRDYQSIQGCVEQVVKVRSHNMVGEFAVVTFDPASLELPRAVAAVLDRMRLLNVNVVAFSSVNALKTVAAVQEVSRTCWLSRVNVTLNMVGGSD